MLLGRKHELETLFAACRSTEAGNGSALVIRGDPGIGKSALLAAVAEARGTRRLLRTTGVEAESTVPLAALQALLWPVRDELVHLDGTQARLLRAVLDLTPQEGTSAFALGAAVLSVLSHASHAEPVLAIVDDAQWVDTSSQDVVAFVGRRLANERITLIVAARRDHASVLADEASFTTIDLGPLDAGSARRLIEQSTSAPLAPEVLERVLDVCAGNPLGLVELPRLLDDETRRGSTPLPAAIPAGPLVQRAFAARVAELHDETRAALLLLAAGDVAATRKLLGDAATVVFDSAEAAGVLSTDGTWEFRHPLIRAAVYGSATPAERREAHRRLATVLTGARRAWHLAEAVDGPNEDVAAELEAAAEESRTAGGVAAQAEALERAASLSERADSRAARLLAAGRSWRRAGRVERSNDLLAAALAATTAEPLRARIQLDRGLNLLRDGANRQAYDLLVVEAGRCEHTHPVIAARLFAAVTLVANVDVGGPSALTFAERALELVGTTGDEAELEVLFSAVSARMSRPAPPDDEDIRLIERAAALLERRELRDGEQPHWIAYALAQVEHDAEARALSDLALAEARAAGDVWSLCYGSYARAVTELVLGRLDAARAWSAEAVPLAEQIGEQWRSEQATAVDTEVNAARGLSSTGPALLQGRAFLAANQTADAIAHLEEAARAHAVETPRAWYQLVPLDLAEAYAIAGRAKDAAAVLDAAAPGIERCHLVRPQARLARVRGLLAPESKIDATFGAARALLENAPHPFEEARIELAWGERLGGAGRSADALPHLDRALTGFDALGATGWSERSRRAMERVTGNAVPMRALRTDVLSPQELRIARHAARGARDREIAALLYLSPRTVESYLHTSYRKLGVGNRTQLAALLASEGITPLEIP